MIKPHLEMEEKKQWWVEGAFSKEAAKKINENLKQVIRNPEGTGHSAQISGTVLAGKTGTAEIKASQTDTSGTELGWFCVYNPEAAQEDALLLVTMVEDVKQRGGSSYVVNKDKALLKKFMTEN